MTETRSMRTHEADPLLPEVKRRTRLALEAVAPKVESRGEFMISLSALAAAYVSLCVATGCSLGQALDGVRESWPNRS